MNGRAASSSTGAHTPTGALLFGAALGLVGIAGLVFGIILPHPLPFVVGALLLSAAVMTALVVRTRRRATSAIIAIALSAALIVTPAMVRVGLTGNSAAWTAQVAEDDLAVIDGQIYTFSFDHSAGGNQRTVRRLDPTDGSVTREWSAEALERPSITADGGVVFAATAVSTNEHSRIITMFDAEGHRMWRAPIETDFDSDIRVTASSRGAVHVVVCQATKSGSDRQGCRIITIDGSGTIVDERGVGFEWSTGNGESWMDLPGGVLPRITLVTDGKNGVDMYSPAAIGPITNLPLGKTIEDYGSRLTHDLLISAERLGEQRCRVVSRSLDDGSQIWAAEVPCTPMTNLRLWATSDENGPLYLTLDQVDDQTASLEAIDPATGALSPIPDAALRHSGPFVSAAQDLAHEATAGRFVVSRDGGRVAAREAEAGATPVEFEVPGTANAPAAAGGNVLAVISDTGAGSVSPAVAHNPYLVSQWFDDLGDRSNRSSADRADNPEYLTVVDATTGEEISSTVFTSAITYVAVLPGGQTVAETEDGTLHVIGN